MTNKTTLAFAGVFSLTLFSGLAQAATLNNMITVTDVTSPELPVMNWSRDLSAIGVVSTDSKGVTSYMGSDSVSMNGMPVWDYSWNLMADPDPFIAGNFTVTNTSSVDQIFDINFSLPVSPAFTNGIMNGSLSASYSDADLDGSATLNINAWHGLVGSSYEMSLFAFAGPCLGTGCSVSIGPVTDGPTPYYGLVDSTIGIHMNITLSAGDSATFDTRFEVNPVPVPAAVWLFGSGLLALFGVCRRKV